MRIDLVLWIIVGLAAIVFGASYICYCMAFFAPRKNIGTEEFPIPPGEEYVPYRAQMIEWMRQVRAMPYEAVEVRSFDGLLYPFVRLGARIFGHFRLEKTSPVEAMRHCRVPVIFFHGEADNFVPCEMSRENYEACAARKKLVTVPGAGHGAAYLVDPEGYIAILKEFWKK